MVLFTLVVLAFFVSTVAMAQESTSASTTPTETTAAPVEEGLTQGKKFGISTAVFCCCAFAWAAFTFIYAKVVDHCPCFKHDIPTAPPRPVSVH